MRERLPQQADNRSTFAPNTAKNRQGSARPLGALLPSSSRQKARARRDLWRANGKTKWCEQRRIPALSIPRPWDLGAWGVQLRDQLGHGTLAHTVVAFVAWVAAAERMGGQYYGCHRETMRLCGVKRTLMVAATRWAIKHGLVEQRPAFTPLDRHSNRETKPCYVLTEECRQLIALGCARNPNGHKGCRVTTSGEIHTQNPDSQSTWKRLRRVGCGHVDLAARLAAAIDATLERAQQVADRQLSGEGAGNAAWLPTRGAAGRAVALDLLQGKTPPPPPSDVQELAESVWRKVERINAQRERSGYAAPSIY